MKSKSDAKPSPQTPPAAAPKRKRSGQPWPVHFADNDLAHIKAVQAATGDGTILSVSEINQRAVRHAMPLFLSGKVNILDVKPLPELPAARTSRSGQ